jgi:FKBP-type peptidyl-prolyl cis-trans isomerase FkpA
MPRRAAVLAPALLLAALAACTLDDDILDPTEVDFAASLDIDLDRMTRLSTGLYYEDTTVGTGDVAAAGDQVDVHYTGWLWNGTEFDTSRDGTEPLRFTIGVTNIILGFAQGVVGMHVGGTRKLVIPPELGYGRNGFRSIPPNATLVFEIELVAIDPI